MEALKHMVFQFLTVTSKWNVLSYQRLILLKTYNI